MLATWAGVCMQSGASWGRAGSSLVPWSPQLETWPEVSLNCPLQVPVLQLAALEALVELEEG